MTARVAAVLILLVSLAGTAAAQPIEEGSIAVIQPRPTLVRQRVEVVPRFGLTINDPLIRQFEVGGSIYYYFTEDFYAGPTFEWYDFGTGFGGTTDTYNHMIEASSSIPEIAPISYFGALDVGWVPVNGKFALFNSAIIYFDIYLLIGGGVMNTVDEIHPAATIAFGERWFLTEWLDVMLEVRDRMYMQPFGDDSVFMNVFTATLGVGFFIPPSFTYEVHQERILDWD